MNREKKLCVIGGGAAGMMAAGTALLFGAKVTLFEGTDRLGKKLAITGKGRCNVTNDCSVEEFLENTINNPRFLYAALNEFSTQDTVNFFNRLGVELKTERGKRVYPATDRAKDIVDAMRRYCSAAETIYAKVKDISATDDGRFNVKADKNYIFDAVIIATGGKSYPLTGSDGSGYSLAMKLGHKVTELTPSLVPLTSKSPLCPKMQGLSLKNISVKIKDENNKILYEDFGEMMFTHFGVTGPVILSASSHLKKYDISKLTLFIDLKPALDEKTLDARLLSDFKDQNNKDFINSLGKLLPTKMIEPFVEVCKIDPRQKVNSITKEQRRHILDTLKNFKIPLSGYRPIEEAIVTSGGIDVRLINPKNMGSKIVSGLFFAGEIIDVDAYTGGFNLQIAFSTGYLAGKSAAEFILEENQYVENSN